MKTHMIFFLLFLSALISSCQDQEFREDKVFVGGKVVPKDTLNLGRLTYLEYCVSCHGVKGDGNGVAAKGLVPRPRDFTQGLFKFGKVPSGELPHDEDLMEIIRRGLNGTAMLPWDISDQRLYAVVQYIKTFAPQVWEQKDKPLAPHTTLNPNPYVANETYAVERGKEVYHVVASCQTCHRAYISHEELNKISMKINKQPAGEFDPTIYNLKLQDSEYKVAFLPPDFTWHEVRSAQTVDELALRIASGIGGTAMPVWKGVIDDDDIWASAYYIRSLMDIKGTPKRDELIKSIELGNGK